jgi:hypothetical protein
MEGMILRLRNFCIASATILLLAVAVLVSATQTAKLEPTQVGFSSNSSWKEVEQAMDVKVNLSLMVPSHSAYQ